VPERETTDRATPLPAADTRLRSTNGLEKSPYSWQLAHFRDLVDAATDVVGSVGDVRTDPAPL
jgi:hypothetical protein